MKGGETLNKNSKEQIVAELAEKLATAKAAYLTDYRGINVDEANTLRGELLKAGVEYRVVKNTLLKLAIKGTDNECLSDHLNGPTSLTIVNDDPVASAKVLSDFAKKVKAFELKCGVLDGKALSIEDITALAALPSREVLLAKMLGSINAPVSNFVGVLAAVNRSLVQVLAAIKDQKDAA
jgi:large subunit ribosomal protein L10